MKSQRPALSLYLAVLLLPFASMAAQKSSSTNVTTIVHDYDTAGSQLLTRSDDANGTGQATYTSMNSRGSSLGSQIINGEWLLSLGGQSLRTLYVTPNNPIDSSQPQGPPAGYYYPQVRSHCFDQNGNIVPFANIVTSSGTCQFGITFTSGGTQYKLLMSPYPFSVDGSEPPTCPSTGCPATGLATVTCNAVANNQCVNWTIAPNTTAPNATVANLYRYQSSKSSATWVFVGQYFNSFRVDVTNP